MVVAQAFKVTPSLQERSVEIPAGGTTQEVLVGVVANQYVLHGVFYAYSEPGGTGNLGLSLHFGADATDRFWTRLGSPTLGYPAAQRFHIPAPGLPVPVGDGVTFVADGAVVDLVQCTLLFELRPFGLQWSWDIEEIVLGSGLITV